ncbi:MAG: hypothetical protein MJ183_00205 [Treponemataceae bacterium]|nr:hypothetical protein [Treponemataceae bacterium]
MEKIGGKTAFFTSGITAGDIISGQFAGAKVLVVGEKMDSGDKVNEAAENLKKHGICVVAAGGIDPDFAAACEKEGICSANLDKRSLEDVIRTFGDKDTESFLSTNEEGALKFKCISGSFSKSYLL